MMNHKHMSITTMSPAEAMCTLVTCLSKSKDEDLCVAVLRHRLQDCSTMALKGSWGPCVSKNSSVEKEGKSTPISHDLRITKFRGLCAVQNIIVNISSIFPLELKYLTDILISG